MSYIEQTRKEIIEAYVFLRTNNMTIPSETLEFMKDSSLKALDQAINYTRCCEELRDEYLQPELDKYKHITIERTKGKSDM